MDNYKLSDEWKALNNIWKKSDAGIREECCDDFRELSELIRRIYCKRDNCDYQYLSALSDEAFNYVVGLINKGEKNMYHSMMAILSSHNFDSVSEFCEYYIEKNSEMRPQWCMSDNRPYIEELSKLCYSKYQFKKKYL